MNQIDDYIQAALKLGFSSAARFDPSALICRPEIRAMCAPDQCPSYGKTWICPPGCGQLKDCAAILKGYRCGILLQSKQEPVDTSDTALLCQLEQAHNARLWQLSDRIRQQDPSVFLLSTGSCKLCSRCTYPTAPCRKPDKQYGALSAFGIDVAALCADAKLDYAFKPGAICYVGCILMA